MKKYRYLWPYTDRSREREKEENGNIHIEGVSE